ncbi:sulfotransferase family protein [Vreelandella aquamarina]
MKKLIITGMPRSGTSWLGQIINSSPIVSFRTEPLFSYRFKNILNTESSKKEFDDFFDSLVNIEDDFILQTEKINEGFYPRFNKSSANILAFKTTRHFELLSQYLKHINEIHIIAIVRHPCAVINSWFNSYREFEKKGCEKWNDWKTGECRKASTGEYWGFNDWLLSTKLFMKLESQYSNFHIVRYSDLLDHTESQSRSLFKKIGIPFTEQTQYFLDACHQRHDNDPYSVFKSKSALNSWEKALNKEIKNEIFFEIKKEQLDKFIN